jgi:O-antigen/teichoic acid export membrane protein
MNHTPNGTLKRRVLNAGIWSLAGYGFSVFLRFGSNLLLTRLLEPQLFGVMSIATIIMVGLSMLSDVGLKQNIIQSSRGHEAKYLNTAWSIQIIRGLMVWAFALIASIVLLASDRAGLVPHGSIYSNSHLPEVIAVMSFSAVILGFESTKSAVGSRNLEIGRITLIEIISQLAGLVLMALLLLYARSVWVLVAGSLCATTISVLLGHAWLRGVKNKFEWDRSAAAEIFRFGRWIIPTSIVGFLAISGDRLLLGGLTDATTFGVYVIAFLIFSSVEMLISKIVVGVTLPALSEIARERSAQLKANYYRVYSGVASATYLAAGTLMIAGSSIISLLYDNRYWDAGWMLQALSIGLIAIPCHMLAQCFIALGRPQIAFGAIMVRFVALFTVLPLAFYGYGFVGALLGVVLSRFLCVPYLFYHASEKNLFDLRKELALTPLIAVGMGVGYLATTVLRYVY